MDVDSRQPVGWKYPRKVKNTSKGSFDVNICNRAQGFRVPATVGSADRVGERAELQWLPPSQCIQEKLQGTFRNTISCSQPLLPPRSMSPFKHGHRCWSHKAISCLSATRVFPRQPEFVLAGICSPRASPECVPIYLHTLLWRECSK